MLTTPPAQPESEEELAAVPDATPAVPPMGYTDFMKKKKEQAYAYTEPEPQENPGDMGGGIPAMAGMIGGGDMSVGDAGGAMGEDYTPQDLQKRVTPEPKPTFQQKMDTMKRQGRMILNHNSNNLKSNNLRPIYHSKSQTRTKFVVRN